ncbi:hypothetical protein K458DRAFT_399226 [Lentithecium fluviatile CBS 122367]|uniref:Uncharacterized protein n=1 Tax=Lentithecium fluviatile CBS 122367 TaxID=1168545 RepID=A0A6G1JMG4_9PLEO|nr:hypothetical protein K458DRAFT_399226 [Lentithecium fluviatile CBS 122367]
MTFSSISDYMPLQFVSAIMDRLWWRRRIAHEGNGSSRSHFPAHGPSHHPHIENLAISTGLLSPVVPDWSGEGNPKGGIYLRQDTAHFEYTCYQDGVYVLSTPGTYYGVVNTVWSMDFQDISLKEEDDSLPSNIVSTFVWCFLQIDQRPKNADFRGNLIAFSTVMLAAWARNNKLSYIKEIWDNLRGRLEIRRDQGGISNWNSTAMLADSLAGRRSVDRQLLLEHPNQIRRKVEQDFLEAGTLSEDEILHFLRRADPDSDIAQKKATTLCSLEFAIIEREALERVEECIKWAFRENITCRDHIGFGTVKMQSGDILAELDVDSFSSLFILRDVGDGLFKIVGEAFVAQLWGFHGPDEALHVTTGEGGSGTSAYHGHRTDIHKPEPNGSSETKAHIINHHVNILHHDQLPST